MSRAVVLDVLRENESLSELVKPANIYPNYSEIGRPEGITVEQPYGFIVLRWGAFTLMPEVSEDDGHGPRELTVWAHYPIEKSNSYNKTDAILSRVLRAFKAVEQLKGSDGQEVTSITYAGGSGDLVDEGFQTITRYSTFRVLSHRAA